MDVVVPVLEATLLTPVVERLLGVGNVLIMAWQIEPLVHRIVNPVSGGLYRVAGQAMAGQRALPWSLVLKVIHSPPDAPAAAWISYEDQRHWNYWQREALAYASDLLTELGSGLVAPHCWGVDAPDPTTRWLWLEDIVGVAAAAWSFEQYGQAARQIGRWQGHYGATQPLPTDSWLSRDWLRHRLALESSKLALLEDPAVWQHPAVRAAFPAIDQARVLALWRATEQLLAGLQQVPQTVCHWDVWPPNLLERVDKAGQPQTVLLDWSYLGYGAFGQDIGNLVPDTTTRWHVAAADLVALEATVFPNYIQGLRESGWHGDPRHVRFGYAATAALIYTMILPARLHAATDPMQRAAVEQREGRPISAILTERAALLSYTLGLADEAMALLPLL